jgi:hypothetical protein
MVFPIFAVWLDAIFHSKTVLQRVTSNGKAESKPLLTILGTSVRAKIKTQTRNIP